MMVWTIAGSDSSGCAGIQADLKTFHNFGVQGCTVITAITAQSSQELNAIHYTPKEYIISQINSLPSPQAIKLGMLGCEAAIESAMTYLQNYNGAVILDPVLISTSGKKLFSGELESYHLQLNKLFPYVSLLTPNLIEAEILLGCELKSHTAIEQGAKKLLDSGIKSVLIKGGHFDQDCFSQDYWTNGTESFWLASPRIEKTNMRGTGCTLSSAIAACLALGYEIRDAIVIAKMYVNRRFRLGDRQVGWPEDQIDLPYLVRAPIQDLPENFPSCGKTALGLYPIVDSSTWIEKLLPIGVTTIQLRIKNKIGVALENEIQKSVAIAKRFNARLFINDYWELAIRYGAYGVHLGQEDINEADIKSIHEAGLRLGLSTHCYYEVARAHAFNPSYLACGPIFPTTSKIMPFLPQGLEHLARWRRTLNYPLVAIGGINVERMPSVLATGVDGIAMISAITNAQDPQAVIASFNKSASVSSHPRQGSVIDNPPRSKEEPESIF